MRFHERRDAHVNTAENAQPQAGGRGVEVEGDVCEYGMDELFALGVAARAPTSQTFPSKPVGALPQTTLQSARVPCEISR